MYESSKSHFWAPWQEYHHNRSAKIIQDRNDFLIMLGEKVILSNLKSAVGGKEYSLLSVLSRFAFSENSSEDSK